MKKYFIKEESASKPGRYLIKMNFDEFEGISTEGSYAVLPARLIGLSYAQYCRMCRDCFGADLVGRDTLYPVVYFQNDELLIMLLRILNARMKLIDTLKDATFREDESIEAEWKHEYEAEFGEECKY